MSDLLKGISLQGEQATAAMNRSKLEQLQSRFGTKGGPVATVTDVDKALEKLPAAERAQVEDAASQFEGMLLQQLFKAMWRTVPEGGMLSSSREESMYRDMLNEALTEDISADNSMGIRDVVLRELVGRYENMKGDEE